MLVLPTSQFHGVSDSNLLKIWKEKTKALTREALWKLMIGLFTPKTEDERHLIHLRQELRSRGLFGKMQTTA